MPIVCQYSVSSILLRPESLLRNNSPQSIFLSFIHFHTSETILISNSSLGIIWCVSGSTVIILHTCFLNYSPFLKLYESMSQAPCRNTHHCGCNEMARTPLCTNRYAISFNRGRAARTSPPAPDQNNSAEDAARGQAIESRLDGPLCSVHSSCWPDGGKNHTKLTLRKEESFLSGGKKHTTEDEFGLSSCQSGSRVERI